jgi:hypothetical protein
MEINPEFTYICQNMHLRAPKFDDSEHVSFMELFLVNCIQIDTISQLPIAANSSP